MEVDKCKSIYKHMPQSEVPLHCFKLVHSSLSLCDGEKLKFPPQNTLTPPHFTHGTRDSPYQPEKHVKSESVCFDLMKGSGHLLVLLGSIARQGL